MAMGAWRDLGHGWVVGNQSAVCGLTACGPLPLLPLPLSFSISVSLLAENHRRLHADRILRPQMIWENMPCLMLCAHLNPVQLPSAAHSLCLFLPGLCVVLVVCVLPPHNLWRSPSPSWSPCCPGWRTLAGRGESLPQTGWSYASQSLNLKHIR